MDFLGELKWSKNFMILRWFLKNGFQLEDVTIQEKWQNIGQTMSMSQQIVTNQIKSSLRCHAWNYHF
jgi:hypothetical protein